MIVLAGADLVLPDRIQRGGSLIIEGDRIAEFWDLGMQIPEDAVNENGMF